MRFLLILLVLLAAPVEASEPFSEVQEKVLRNFAGALLAARHCSELQVNPVYVQATQQWFDEPISSARISDFVQAEYDKQIAGLQKNELWVKYPDAVTCPVGKMLYGPRGANVPNFLIPK